MVGSRDGEALYGSLAGLYDRMYSWKGYRSEARELLRIIRSAGVRPPASLLDVACGTGAHLAEFLGWVPDVAGVDRSRAMLSQARRRLGRSVPLTRADMRTFDLGRRFDVVVCLFSAFGYMLTRRDRDRAVAAMARHLNPGGVLLIEGWILPDRYRGDGRGHLLTYDGADAKVARLSTTHRSGDRTRLEMQYLVWEPGRGLRHFREIHVNAMVPATEILGSFRRAGLRARVRRTVRWRDRGLYIGVAPRGPITSPGPGRSGGVNSRAAAPRRRAR